MELQNSTEILLGRRHNPHRYGSLDYRRWNVLKLLADAQHGTVGNFVAAHNETGEIEVGGLGNTWNAKRYLVYMARRGMVTLVGVTIAPATRRAPRAVGVLAPLSTDLDSFTFGCEFECILPRGMTRSAAAAQVSLAGVDCREDVYGHAVRNWWKVVADGSLGDYVLGAEFVSPVLCGQDGLNQVEKVARALQALGAKVNKKCGFHVHVGARDRDVDFFRRLLTAYANNEGVLDSMMPASRRGTANHYCQPVSTYGFSSRNTRDELLRHAGRSRYVKLNVASYYRHGTVEFRQHAGTVEADKATYWVKFCLRFCALAASTNELPSQVSLNDLMTAVGASDDERAFLLNRAAHFAAAPTARAA